MQQQECIAAQMSYKPGETGHQSALTHTLEVTAVDFDLQVKNRKNGNLYQGVNVPKQRCISALPRLMRAAALMSRSAKPKELESRTQNSLSWGFYGTKGFYGTGLS